MSYYFLIASLPSLRLGETPAVTREVFLERSSEQLSVRELDALQRFLDRMPKEKDGGIAREWLVFEVTLRNACARQRAALRGVNPRPFLREPSEEESSIRNFVEAAFAAENPLERERVLDRARWNELERLAGYDPFTFRALQAYAMRLGIAWHWAGMNADEGKNKAARLAGLTPDEAVKDLS